MLEFIQYLHFPVLTELGNYKIFAYILGTSYDGADFIYYSIGAFVAAVVLFAFEAEEAMKKGTWEEIVTIDEGREDMMNDKGQVTRERSAERANCPPLEGEGGGQVSTQQTKAVEEEVFEKV